MWITWRERLQQYPQLNGLNNWPSIDPLSLPAGKRRDFFRNRAIVGKALASQSLKSIAAEHRINSSFICRLLERCLGGAEDSAPMLTKALIPGYRVKDSMRQHALPTVTRPQGCANAFCHLLNTVPGLQHYLHKQLKLYATRSRRGQNLRVKNFHKSFLRYLMENHWPQDTYPFSHPSQGYESLRRYFHRQLQTLHLPKTSTRVILPAHHTVSIYDEIQIDEHCVDCRGSVVIELNRQWEALPVGRITLIAARDVATGAVLGYCLVLRGNATQDDVLSLIQIITSPWQPRLLSMPQLAFPSGDFMPTQLGEAFCRPALGIIRFDNAMVHRALTVRDYICDTLGATFQLGLPKYPLARALIESAFRDLNLSIHRVPSTTGSFPTDPLREPAHHQKKAPLISIKLLEDMIHLHAATMNQRLMGNLGARSPIDVMKYQMIHHLVPLRPPLAPKQLPMNGRAEVTVHISVKDRRTPWVNFAYKQYRGALPSSTFGKKIWIEFDRRDIRQVEAYSQQGDYLGVLKAPLSWQRFPHSLVTARYIHELVKADRMKAADPLGGYYDYLTRHRTLPSEALELVRISREFGQYAEPAKPAEQHKTIRTTKASTSVKLVKTSAPASSKPAPSQRPVPSIPLPDWSSAMVDNRRQL